MNKKPRSRVLNMPFYRHMISKRAAVCAVVEISEVLSDSGEAYYYGYNGGAANSYDSAIYNLVDCIKELKREVEEYRALKAALRPIIKYMR